MNCKQTNLKYVSVCLSIYLWVVLIIMLSISFASLIGLFLALHVVVQFLLLVIKVPIQGTLHHFVFANNGNQTDCQRGGHQIGHQTFVKRSVALLS